jgi:hypothetical protein
MEELKCKETILTYVKQYETDAAIGFTPDRTRRSLMRRFYHNSGARSVYERMVKNGDIRELIGPTGSVTVIAGPSPSLPAISPKLPASLPFPYNQIDPAVLQAFCIRMCDLGISNVKLEVSKALEGYQSTIALN